MAVAEKNTENWREDKQTVLDRTFSVLMLLCDGIDATHDDNQRNWGLTEIAAVAQRGREELTEAREVDAQYAAEARGSAFLAAIGILADRLVMDPGPLDRFGTKKDLAIELDELIHAGFDLVNVIRTIAEA